MAVPPSFIFVSLPESMAFLDIVNRHRGTTREQSEAPDGGVL